MGKFTRWESIKFWFLDVWPCWMIGHRFKFIPMEGDPLPHEFENCSACGIENPTFNV